MIGSTAMQEMLDAVPVPAAHPQFSKPGYGFGVMVDLGSTHGRVAGHEGGGPGYTTAAFHVSEVDGHRLTAAAMTNRDGNDLATRIAFDMVEAFGKPTE